MLRTIVFLFCSLPLYILGQQYHFQNITVQNGLPQSQVYALCNSDNGSIWIGTQGGGLANYNGNTITTFTKKDGLASDYINDILYHNSKVYLATAQGLSYLENKKWKSIDTIQNLTALLSIGDSLLITSESYLYLYHENSIKKLNTPKDSWNAIIHFNNEIYIGGNKGLYNFSQQKWTNQKNIKQISSLAQVGKTIIVGTYGSGLWRYYENDSIVPFDMEASTPIITSLMSNNDSTLYIGTLAHGAYIFEKEQLKVHFTAQDGLANNHVRSFLTDNWGGIWIGTSGGGLQKYAGSQFLHMTRRDGINGNFVYTVKKTSQSTLWLGTETGAQKLTDTGWVHFDKSNMKWNSKIKTIFETPNKEIWLGSEGEGLAIIKKDTNNVDSLVYYDRKDGLSSNWIKDIIYHPVENHYYIATLGGGLSIANEKIDSTGISIQFQKIKNSKIPLRINQLALDQNNRVWMCSDNNGVGYWNKGINFPINNEILFNTRVRSLIAAQNRIWIGTASQGLLYIDITKDSLKILPYEHNKLLTSNNIYQLAIDHNQVLWIGTEKGMDKIEFPLSKEITVQHFGITEGFMGLETCQNSIYTDSNGYVYIGTISGLEIYTPQDIIINNNSPQLVLENVLLFYRAVAEDKKQFDYSENHFGFNFEAIYLPAPNSIEYQWRLVGYETEWSPWTAQKAINYSNLSPGNYTFEVRSRSTHNLSESQTIQYHFEIVPPFWQMKWFIYTLWASAIFLLIIIISLIIFRIKKKNRLQLEKIKIEKDLVELEQKALRLQMNPHFIFNALNSIQYRIGREDPKVARYQLAKFSKLMRKILENSRESLISIEDEVDTLIDYVQLENFASEQEVKLNIHYDENVDYSAPILPPLLLQPFVENAILHGFNTSINEPVIELNFKIKDLFLVCTIVDNGIGRKAAQKNTPENHKSTALIVTQERLDKLNKKTEYQALEIIDLPEGGTKIILYVRIDNS